MPESRGGGRYRQADQIRSQRQRSEITLAAERSETIKRKVEGGGEDVEREREKSSRRWGLSLS